jgi:multiple antibiotic resistance protein
MTDASLPWGTLFGLLFMTMGPIRAVAVFANFGDSDEAPEVRALAARVVGLVAIAFAIAVVIGDQALTRWGVGLPALIAAAGIILTMLSLHAMITSGPTATSVINVAEVRAAQVAFPGLFPPIAVTLPIIFTAAAPGLANKAIILALGLLILALNWLAMRYSKTIIKAIGPTPLQLLGAVFGVLQVALGVEFVLDAYRML